MDFEVNARGAVLVYEPELGGPEWIVRELNDFGRVTISRAFTFDSQDLLQAPNVASDEPQDPTFRFQFASKRDGYFVIPGRIFGIANEILIAETIWLDRKFFVAERNIGIFRRIARAVGNVTPIIVGGNNDAAIPESVYRDLLARFPTTGELDRYAAARVETIVGEYFDGLKSARDNYEAYLSKRIRLVDDAPLPQSQLLRAEIDKFIYLRDTISQWLTVANSYSEADWQRMIIKVILLLFPKYIHVEQSVTIADYYSRPGQRRSRQIDICLIDASGNLDVVEIKKPFDDVLLAKRPYRDNAVPTRELAGSIMQAEKYLFHLTKWGVEGERELTQRFAARLPADLKIKITSPKAMIILGRDQLPGGGDAFTPGQLLDLEVLKRKYANIMDIITYDDLLRRLSNIIASLRARLSESTAIEAPVTAID